MHLFLTSRLDERVGVAPTVMHDSRIEGNTYSNNGAKRTVETYDLHVLRGVRHVAVTLPVC